MTPAVTKVDEWTKADTGVGAAMALGNQVENGIWALFVNPAIDIIIIIIKKDEVKEKIDQLPELNINAPAIINLISPNRLIMNVDIANEKTYFLW